MSDNLSLYAAQMNDVQKMRDQILSFNRNDPNAARKAIQNVTLLRVYHQLERIIKFTEMMDKIEDRIYQSIDSRLNSADPDDPDMWLTLIPLQERLQRVMVESHKLLEPYLNAEQLNVLSVEKEEDPADSFTSMILDQESRERVRTGVQELLHVINTFDGVAKEEPSEGVRNKAQEALAELDKVKETEDNA